MAKRDALQDSAGQKKTDGDEPLLKSRKYLRLSYDVR